MTAEREDAPIMARPADGNPWAGVVRPTDTDRPINADRPTDTDRPEVDRPGPATDEIPVVDRAALVDTEPPAVHRPHARNVEVDHLPVVAGHVVDTSDTWAEGGPVREPALARFVGRPMLDTPLAHIPARMWATARGAVRAGAYITVHSYRELWPILVGLAEVIRRVLWWMRGGHDWDIVSAEPDPHARSVQWAKPERVRSRQWRRRIVAVTTLLLVLAVVVLPAQVPGWSTAIRVAVAAVVVIGLDILGRRTLAARDRPVTPIYTATPVRSLLGDPSTPIRQLEAAVLDTLEGLGHQPTLHQGWDTDTVAGESTITIGHTVALSDADLSAVAIALGAEDGGLTTRKTGVTGSTQLRFRRFDPLEGSRTRDDREMGATVTDMIHLGRSAGPLPLALGFAGEHMAVIGSTGGGKTDTFQSMAMALAECKDVVLRGGDITKGAALGQLEDLFETVAYTRDDVLAMLDRTETEMRQRAKVLKAARKDPVSPTGTWSADMGPAIVTMLDEAHEFGTDPDIVRLIENIARIGRDTWVSVVLFTQRYSVKDIGTAAIKSQVNTVIMHPMKKRDLGLVELHKDDIAEGWAPHMLTPASELGGPGDAGKAFIRSPFGHADPWLYRFDRMPSDMRAVNRRIADLARWRRSIGLVPDDAVDGATMRATSDVNPGVEDATVVDMAKRADTSVVGGTSVDGSAPEAIRWLVELFAAAGDVSWLPTGDVVAHARAAAGDPNSPYRGLCRRIAEASQPEVVLSRVIREQCGDIAGAKVRAKRGGGGPDRNTRGISRAAVLSLAHLEQDA